MARHGESKHLKRSSVAKVVRIPRKKYKYYARNLPGKHENKYAVSLLGLVRDVGGFARNSREAKYLIKNGMVLIDGTKVKEEHYNVGFGDIVTIGSDNFIVWFGQGRRLVLKPYDTPNVKTIKVLSKRLTKGGKTVVSTSDGRNIICNVPVNTGDSIRYDLKDKKIVQVVPFEQGRDVLVYKGKNVGLVGKIKEIAGDNVYIVSDSGENVSLSDFCMVL